MNGDAYAILRQAIQNKLQVTCTYRGYPRELCPHVVGTKDGRRQVLAYQFAGQSSSGLPPGGEWRCMVVDEVENAQAREGPWHTGHSHTQPQTCVDHIDIEVAY